jgi:hypothetical protein
MAYPSHNLKAVRPAAGPNEHNPELLSDWFLLIAKKINELSMRVIYPLSQV